MKKSLITLGIVGTLTLGGLIFGGKSQPQTQAQIEAIVNSSEAAYFQVHGNYAQILCGRKIPSDQTYTWNDIFGSRITNPDFDVCVDVWGGPKGKGYKITVTNKAAPQTLETINSTSTPQ